MRTLLQDLRYAVRMALKAPGFTLMAVATLAIGIAASTTVFTWIDAIVLRPIPGAARPDQLASFESLDENGSATLTSYPDYRDHRDHLKLLSGLASAYPNAMRIGLGTHSERAWGQFVSGNFFAVLGVKPVAGRFFSPDEYGDKQGAYPVAVIGYGLWQRDFHGDDVIGRTIRVNRVPLTIIGVAPKEFRGSSSGLMFELWTPLMMAPQMNAMPDWMLRDRHSRILWTIARLRPGVTLAQARSEVSGLAAYIARVDADTNLGIGATLVPMAKAHFGAQSLLGGPLNILLAVCCLVLLIACANVANLLLARGSGRSVELSVRMALGAGRLRVLRQLLTEALFLAGLATLAAGPMTMWMMTSLGYLIPRGDLPSGADMHLNGDILAFTAMLCILVSLAAGAAPALYALRGALREGLAAGGRSGTSAAASARTRGMLVSAEVALALVAIIGAALFARSFQVAAGVNPGFNTHDVVISHLDLTTAGYSVPQRREFCQRLRERMQTEPGVVSAAYVDLVPLGYDYSWEPLQVEGYVARQGAEMNTDRALISPGYFGLLKIPLIEGRDFTDHDDEKTYPAAIVNETFARLYFHGRNPVGAHLHGWGKWFTVVGVAADSKYRTPTEAPRPFLYVPFQQIYRADMQIAFLVRSKAGDAQALTQLRGAIHSMDPEAGVYGSQALADSIGVALMPQRMAASLLGALGAIALLLAAIGLYSVMACTVVQRRQEIAIRMAIGAKAADVLRLVVRQGMAMTAAGLLAGIAAAAAVTRIASGLLFGVSSTDPAIFTGATVFLAVVALAACWLPAHRATRIDPNMALRQQ
jgi:predicted permease